MLFRRLARYRLAFALAIAFVSSSAAAADAEFTRTEDVIYGRKWGMALTMDVFRPVEKEGVKQNGAGLILCVSGGFFSDKAAINKGFVQPFVNRGYAVFAVVHGSQPKFTIPEVVADMNRAVRYIRAHAGDYGVDPDRLGIYGGSAGGHLSLMLGTAGAEGAKTARDGVDRESSRVQAVACFFPPTDFLNYGKPGEVALGTGVLSGFKAPFDFTELDGSNRSFKLITDQKRREEIGREISPVNHASSDDPPTLIIHGDADKLVPIQQAELMVEALKKAGVETELVVKKGAAHGWSGMDKDLEKFADWFDKHLAKRD
ncbi:MAG: alpha/beta hydrolase [Planctomycetota bacterium]|nr:MAG: alpha/beta hydrolase [Planctomycetota bacterium]